MFTSTIARVGTLLICIGTSYGLLAPIRNNWSRNALLGSCKDWSTNCDRYTVLARPIKVCVRWARTRRWDTTCK